MFPLEMIAITFKYYDQVSPMLLLTLGVDFLWINNV